MNTQDIQELLAAICRQAEQRNRMDRALMEIERLVENFATDHDIELTEPDKAAKR